eukprot:snap_masked-scaffold_28-processed-gene-4.23-mRNA-1 protein AED:1.00 eAED:1.00 QI:0/0/0/0/1/1/2/0/164
MDYKLNDVGFWPAAQNLLSVSALVRKGLSVRLSETSAEIRQGTSTLYKATLDGDLFPGKVKTTRVPKVSMLSAHVWHCRLNHCSQSCLEETLKGVEELTGLVEKSVCTGCMEGKMHRTPVSKKKSPTECQVLELLVADCVGPYKLSVDRKRGALVVGDARSGFL